MNSEAEKGVKLARVEIDASTQTRAVIDAETVEEYAEVLRAADGWPFPPVVLYQDGRKFWIGDGFHRCLAADAAGRTEVRAVVHRGGRSDALRYALGANAHHGLRRTRADIRRAIELADDEWPELTNNGIAELVGVSHNTVAKWRPERVGPKQTADGRTLTKPAGTKAGENPPPPPADDPQDGWIWVECDERPTAGEVEAWVEPIPTWGELAEGSGAEVRELPTEPDGVPAPHVRRDLVLEWCAMPGEDGKPRFAGLRRVPISLEHAHRERDRYQSERKIRGNVDWMRKLGEILLLELPSSEDLQAAYGAVIARQAAKHATPEAVRCAAGSVGKEESVFLEECKRGDGDMIDALKLLLGTELHAVGAAVVEQQVIREMMEVLQ